MITAKPRKILREGEVDIESLIPDSDETDLSDPEDFTTRRRTAMAKKKVKEEAAPSKKETKAEKPNKNVITAKQLAADLGVDGRVLRLKLRNAGFKRPEGERWQWDKNSPELQKIKDLFKKKAKAKKAEEEDEDEEEEEEDED